MLRNAILRESGDVVLENSIGGLTNEISMQELNSVEGGTTPTISAVTAIVSALTAVTALTRSVEKDITVARGCGVFLTVSKECWGFTC